ncbi:hypothetical protein BGZ73_001878 [Actinomortierella ambigua]|nr:hypothetical protein BGZ73_001878 [Actinomortierella ambigua]
MRPPHTALSLWAVATFILSVSVSQAAPIHRRHLEESSVSGALHKRWMPSEGSFDLPVIPPPPTPASVGTAFLGRDGHAIFDDDDDDAGNEMLDTEELLLRPDADDEIEGTIEGQVLETEEDDDDYLLLETVEDDGDGEDLLKEANLEAAISHAFLEKDEYMFYQQQQPSPAAVAHAKPELVHPIVTRVDGARTRSRALK